MNDHHIHNFFSQRNQEIESMLQNTSIEISGLKRLCTQFLKNHESSTSRVRTRGEISFVDHFVFPPRLPFRDDKIKEIRSPFPSFVEFHLNSLDHDTKNPSFEPSSHSQPFQLMINQV